MANTIKFGNGQWATKEDSILAYNDENANFKPLPFVTSRATTATRVNKAGLLETVASGVPRVDYLDNSKGSYLLEPTSRNLISQSEAFGNSYWTKSGATIEGDASTVGVEKVVNGDFTGGTTGWTLGTGYTISGGVLNLTNVNGGTAQFSVWEIGKMYLVTVDYNFVSGTRLILPYDGTNQVSIITSASSGTSSYYYTPSATTMYIYSDGNGNGSIDNVSVKEVQGFSAPSVDSPLGAFKLVEDTSTGLHRIRTIGISTSGSVSSSVMVKSDGRDWILLRENSETGDSAYFDISNGVIGTTNGIDSWQIDSMVDGWYRISTTNTILARAGFEIRIADANNSDSYTGDGTSGVYLFASQLEQQSYATSYIPTKGSQISRLSESASQTLPDGIIGQTEGTIYCDFNVSNVGSKFIFSLDDGGASDFIILDTTSVNALDLQIRQSSGSITRVILGNVLSIGNHKIGVNYKSGDYSLYVDGNLEGTSTSTLFPSGIIGRLSVGGNSSYGNLSDTVNDFKLYNTRLSNSELQTLTTI